MHGAAHQRRCALAKHFQQLQVLQAKPNHTGHLGAANGRDALPVDHKVLLDKRARLAESEGGLVHLHVDRAGAIQLNTHARRGHHEGREEMRPPCLGEKRFHGFTCTLHIHNKDELKVHESSSRSRESINPARRSAGAPGRRV